MTSNQNYKPIEILRAFEEGDDIPALEAGLSHQDNTWVTAQFIRQIDQVCDEFTKGADPKRCMDRVRDLAADRGEEWCVGGVARDALECINYGQVYALVNESMPGIFKVGFTTGLARDRAHQLSAATGVPTPFKLLFSYDTINCRRVESGIHDLLSEKRINESREFFRCKLSELLAAFESAITAEYGSNGFAMGGPVVMASDFYPDMDCARRRCQLFAHDPISFFHPKPVEPAENPFS